MELFGFNLLVIVFVIIYIYITYKPTSLDRFYGKKLYTKFLLMGLNLTFVCAKVASFEEDKECYE